MATTHRGITAPRSSRLPEDVGEALQRFRGRLGHFGASVSWFTEVGSTNDVAVNLAEQDFPEGTLVGADMQTHGRGRHGRSWASPAGAGLYVSILLRPSDRAASLLTLAAGVAAVDGIREATGLAAALKWPNDLYVGDRKLAGILAEAGTTAAGVRFVVVGIGINLLPAAYPSEIAARITSLASELARPVDRGLILATCVAGLRQRYQQLTTGAEQQVISAWRAYGSHMFGRVVECTIGSRVFTGLAEDINRDGALLVRTPEGVLPVISGQVTWR